MEEIKEQLENDVSWTTLFKVILNEYPIGKRNQMVFFRELQCHFEVKVTTLSMIGGWDYWDNGSYIDDDISKELQDRLSLKE